MKSKTIVKTFAQWIPLTAILIAWSPVMALTDEALFRDFKFSFAPAGARTLGMGGCAIAAVNDTTAMVTNPAALEDLPLMEFVGELRLSASGRFDEAGSTGSLDLTGQQFPYVSYDTVATPDDGGAMSFLGFALPFRGGPTEATFAFSRHVVFDRSDRLDDSSVSFALEDWPVWINPTGNDGNPAVEQYHVVSSTTGGFDARLVNYNVGLSFPFLDDFSFGATATLSDLEVISSSLNTIEDPQGYLELPVNPRADDDGDGMPDVVRTLSQISGSDTALGYTLAVRYRPDGRFASGTSPISVALVYTKGAELEVEQTIAQLDATTGLPETDPLTGAPELDTFMNAFRVPDRMGLGLAGRPGPGWIVSLDVERVQYSDLLENFQSGKNPLTGGFVDAEVLQQNDADALSFQVDDATVFHVGAEYALNRGRWDLGFRGGYYNEPDSRVRMIRFNSDSAEINQAFVGAQFAEQDADHLTAGVSIGTPLGLQVHLAADLSDSNDRYLLSAIYRMGRRR